ncbi:MAG: hypothetical protein NT157_06770 [Candidatus Micrarchaeota archaeon]|nr:hypothetical protein [Candidatus Micrarchaeota archaeon]
METQHRIGFTTALIGLTLASFVVGAVAEPAKVAETPAKPVVEERVGRYPNFTNYGVQGNPAAWTEIGEWGYLEAGRLADGTRTSDIWLSKKVGGDVIAVGSLSFSLNGEMSGTAKGLRLAFPVTDHISVGGQLTESQFGEGPVSRGFAVGAMGVVERDRTLLLRGGLQDDGTVTRGAVEVRKLFEKMKIEATASVSASVDRAVDKMVNKGVGVQLKKGNNLVSIGKGGPDWKDMKLHYRRVMGKTIVDLHVAGRGNQVVKKPYKSCQP